MRKSLPWLLPLALSALTVVVMPAGGTPAPEPQVPDMPVLPDSGPTATALGLVFPRPPERAPHTHAEKPTLQQIRAAVREGRSNEALRLAESFVAHARWSAERDAVWNLIGHLHRAADRHNLASEAFTKVRAGKGRLAEDAAFYEAEQDFRRGKPLVAIRECEQLLEAFPDSRHRDTCTRLSALAWAREGHETRALDAARAYDKDRDIGHIEEQVRLAVASWEARQRPASAIPKLKQLATVFDAPLTGRRAEELLAELHAAGHADATLPTDLPSLQARAVSMRNSGRLAEAIAQFDAVAARKAEDASIAKWVEASEEVFGWRTRTYDRVEAILSKKYAEKPESDTLWQLHKAQGRAGRWKQAAATAEIGLERFGKGGPWRYDVEVVARTFLLAGQYQRATQVFDALAQRGGWTGRRAAFHAAFATHQGGDLEGAIERYGRVIDEGRVMQSEARYWRARALRDLQRPDEASADLQIVAESAEDGWYAILARQLLEPEAPPRPLARDGRWPGPPLPEAPEAPSPLVAADPGSIAFGAPASARRVPAAPGFGQLAFPLQASAPPAPSEVASLPVDLLLDPPPSYTDGPLFHELTALEDLNKLAKAWHDTWPELGLIHDYAAVGLYDHAGPLMARFHEDWRVAMRSGGSPRSQAARKMALQQEHWRPLFLVSRDHHHVSRYLYGMHTDIPDPQVSRAVQRLGWPLAHDLDVWRAGREHDVDPLLVLGLMRQESNYSPIATSQVGARGAMQIMPRTGHLLANLSHDGAFTAGDLEDPALSVRYGIRYLGLLFERFDGVYPLAVASYNGGPHNVSSWLAGTGLDMPMDVFVEHIPFRETRDYVKKVSSGYATYADLYAPTGTRVRVPERPRADRPAVVDF